MSLRTVWSIYQVLRQSGLHSETISKKQSMRGWLSNWENCLLFQRTWVQVPAPARTLTTKQDSSFRRSYVLFWPLWILSKHTIDMVDIHTCRQNIHTRRKKPTTLNRKIKTKQPPPNPTTTKKQTNKKQKSNQLLWSPNKC